MDGHLDFEASDEYLPDIVDKVQSVENESETTFWDVPQMYKFSAIRQCLTRVKLAELGSGKRHQSCITNHKFLHSEQNVKNRNTDHIDQLKELQYPLQF